MRRAWIALLALCALPACATTNTVQCGDVTCPAGTRCGPANECVPDDCGDGIVAGLEQCDGTIDPEALRCTDYGFYAGPALTCSDTCNVDTSKCSLFCGDHTVNGLERCDGVPAVGFSCADFGFDVGTIGCTSACSPAFDFCSTVGWQLVPGGAQDELYGVFLVTPDSGIAVGRSGTIVGAKDGVWLPVTSPTTQSLNGIFGNTTGVIAVGDGGTIVKNENMTATVMVSPTTNDLRAISGTPTGMVAVGAGGTIIRYDGTSWTSMTSPVSDDLLAVFVVNQVLAYAVGENGTVLRYTAAGWAKITPAGIPTVPLRSVFAVGNAIFVGGDGTYFAYLDMGGATSVPPPLGVLNNLSMHSIWGTAPDDIYVAGDNGVVMHWNGSYLARQDTPTVRPIYALHGIGGKVVGVTRGGTVIAFSGTSRRVDEPTVTKLYAVHTDGANTVAVGDVMERFVNGAWEQTALPQQMKSVFQLGQDLYMGSRVYGLYKTTTTALTPTQVSPTGVYAVWATASPLRIVTVGAQVIESTDGTTFPQTPTTTLNGSHTLHDVWASSDGVWYSVGEGGFAMRRAAGGTWTDISPPGVATDLMSVWGSSAADVFAVGTYGTILHWDGTAWSRMYNPTGENFIAVSGNTHSDVFAVGTSFTRFHYDGLSWSRMAAYDIDMDDVSTAGGTTLMVGGSKIERLERPTLTTETRCGDPWDNDNDGLTNCDDPNCIDDLQCRRGGACETLDRVSCDTSALATTSYSGVARIDNLPCLDHATPGPEASYRYVADHTGTITVSIDSTFLDLVVADAMGGHCELATCRAATTSGTTQSVTLDVTFGQMYYIVVDGPVGTGADFTLSVSCP